MNKILVGLTSVALMATSALPVAALAWGNDIEVENNNHAYVSNEVYVGANTGSNVTMGGDGGSTFFGGTANGGSNSGHITTGNAYANGEVTNVVNKNITKIKASCRWRCSGDVEVENDNGARVGNGVEVIADAGSNDTYGGLGGHAFGGAANGGSNSGDIITGAATSVGNVVNVVNKNVTRIRR